MKRLVWPAAVMFGWMPILGCGGSGGGGPAGVPGGSRLVDDRADAAEFKATEPGTIYLRDVAADRVAYEARIEPGQTFVARGGAATLNGNPLANANLRPNTSYQLFFKPAGKREYHPMYNP